MGIVGALLVLGAAGGMVARGARQAVGFAGAGIGGLGVLLTLLFLVLDQIPDTLELPFGPPGLALHLGLDPLSGYFLLLAFLAGTAGIAFAAETEATAAPVTLADVALCLAGVALATLAADGITLAVGLSLVGGAIWATGEPGRPRALQLGVTLLAALATIGATALSGLTFEAIRDQPTQSAAGFALALIAAGPLSGLVPGHAWLIPAHRAVPNRAGALLSGAVQPLAVYILLRLLLDLAGPSPPLWWSVPLLATGAASILIGGWHAATEADIDSCLAAITIRQSGLAAIGIGLALLGRAADLPNLTTLALAAVLLLALAQAVCATLSHLAAGAIRHGAGSRRVALLGGLIHPMPVVTLGMGAALFGLSALPAGAGFAALWLLFQALLAAPRSLGILAAIGLACVAAVLALSAALSAAALVRLLGVAFLGRPRGPRAAGAVDIGKPARPTILALVAGSMLVGLFPGAFLQVLAEPAVRQLANEGLGPRAGLLGLFPAAGVAGYQVLPLVVLAGLILAGALALLRRRGGTPPRTGPAWNDGFAPPPAWLPFGDPLTQAGGAGFVPALPKRSAWPRLTIAPLWGLLAAAAGLLAVLAWIEGA